METTTKALHSVQLRKESIIYALKKVSCCSKITRLAVGEKNEIFKGDCWEHDRELGWIFKGSFYVTFSEVKYYQQV